MDKNVVSSEERFMNWVFLGANIVVPIVAFSFVMLFLKGLNPHELAHMQVNDLGTRQT